MPCLAPNGFDLVCPFEPHTCTEKIECGGVRFVTSTPARRCPVCGLVALGEGSPARERLLVGLALANLGRFSPEAIRTIRLGLELTGAELGQLLGVTPETISHWENGRNPQPRTAWVTLACLAAEALDRPATPAAWLRTAGDPRPLPRKALAIDTGGPVPASLGEPLVPGP